MAHLNRRQLLSLCAGTCLVLPSAFASRDASAATARSKPTWEKVEQIARTYFESLPDRRPEDILSQGQVKPLLIDLERAGWKITDAAEILKRVPADDDFLVKQFRTPAGTEFMRQIARYPEGYDRCDHLSRLPQGEAKVKELIRGPGGYKMIEYMATASGGKELGKMLSVDRGGRGFNSPTGKLYTQSAVMEALKASYARSAQAGR